MHPFPFFLGRGRSGTTLLRAMFDAHPDMAIPHESHFVVNMGLVRDRYEKPGGFDVDAFLDDLRPTIGFNRWKLPEEDVRRALVAAPPADYPEAMRTLYRTYAAAHGKTRYGDKTPIYVIHIDFLAELFPEARFVHIIRDGRDVALSYLKLEFGPSTLEEAAVYWKRFVEKGRASGAKLGPGRYTEVRYEEILEDPEGNLKRLCEFADLDFDPRMLRYFERAETLVPGLSHHSNLSQPPTKMKTWREKMSREQVMLFEALAGDLLGKLGYERPSEKVPLTTRIDAQRRWAGVQAKRAIRRARKIGASDLG